MGNLFNPQSTQRMNTYLAILGCLLCLAVNQILATGDDKDVAIKKDDDSFFAARGRRADASDDDANANDFFWANRGKRSSRALRDQGTFNVPRPNGFFFPSAGKRAANMNIPRPNGFFFPSANGKRALMSHFFSDPSSKRGGFNLPRPNGFLFPSMSKREAFNLPRPNGFLFPSKKLGKRSGSKMWNMIKPNGFFFPSVPKSQVQGKRSDDEYLDDDESVENEIELYNLLSTLFRIPDEDDVHESSKRDNFDEATFFAGRGRRSADDEDLDAFFAGRGKKNNNNADLEAFFAGRGKKGDADDIFFAGRG